MGSDDLSRTRTPFTSWTSPQTILALVETSPKRHSCPMRFMQVGSSRSRRIRGRTKRKTFPLTTWVIRCHHPGRSTPLIPSSRDKNPPSSSTQVQLNKQTYKSICNIDKCFLVGVHTKKVDNSQIYKERDSSSKQASRNSTWLFNNNLLKPWVEQLVEIESCYIFVHVNVAAVFMSSFLRISLDFTSHFIVPAAVSLQATGWILLYNGFFENVDGIKYT